MMTKAEKEWSFQMAIGAGMVSGVIVAMVTTVKTLWGFVGMLLAVIWLVWFAHRVTFNWGKHKQKKRKT